MMVAKDRGGLPALRKASRTMVGGAVAIGRCLGMGYGRGRHMKAVGRTPCTPERPRHPLFGMRTCVMARRLVAQSRQRNSPDIVRRRLTLPQPRTLIPREKATGRHRPKALRPDGRRALAARGARSQQAGACRECVRQSSANKNNHPSAGSRKAHDGGRMCDCEGHLPANLFTFEFTTAVRARMGGGRSPK